MCDCKNTDQWSKALMNAKQIELRTGVVQAVYTNKETKKSSFGAEYYVKTLDGICCYYLTNGKEVLVPAKKAPLKTSKTKKKATKKAE